MLVGCPCLKWLEGGFSQPHFPGLQLKGPPVKSSVPGIAPNLLMHFSQAQYFEAA